MSTKSIAWKTGSGNITLTYQGQGDGTIIVNSDENDLGSARSQTITIKTVDGTIIKNLTVSQAACPIPVGTVLTYSYTGTYQEVTLPAGTYKLQCWGAKGGSNAAASSYSITAKAGGKGGYSEGIITLSTKTTVRVYVGGQGTSSAGGFNGGGSTTGSSSYSTGTSGQAGYTYGTSRMGGGGGATDIRLSDGALLSRMIVAGGGAGGAMCYQKKTTATTQTYNSSDITEANGYIRTDDMTIWTVDNQWHGAYIPCSSYRGGTCQITRASGYTNVRYAFTTNNVTTNGATIPYASGYSGHIRETATPFTVSVPLDASYLYVYFRDVGSSIIISKVVFSKSSTTATNESQVGGIGGGTQGGAYSSSYAGKQNAAGSGGSFGQGANQTATNYRYCSGAGGGGWYGGGGGQKSNSSMLYCKYSGGGSGWVNTAANAGNRPSGYTGLQLDSGETKAGNTSFPNTAGTGNETGHSGNGYAKITRLS